MKCKLACLAAGVSTLLLLAACQGGPTNNPAAAGVTVNGTVTYTERIALPDDAVVAVSVIDVSGGANTIMGTQQINTDGNQVPIPFEVGYGTADINQEQDYAVGATIADGAGKLLFETTSYIPVITKGHPFQDVVVTVAPVGEETAAAASDAAADADAAPALVGTTWRAILFNNGAGQVLSVNVPTIDAIFAADGTVSGFGGCNQYRGPYTADGNTLRIGPLAATRKACADPEGIMEEESQFLDALVTATSYQVEGEILEMQDASGVTAVQFEQGGE